MTQKDAFGFLLTFTLSLTCLGLCGGQIGKISMKYDTVSILVLTLFDFISMV